MSEREREGEVERGREREGEVERERERELLLHLADVSAAHTSQSWNWVVGSGVELSSCFSPPLALLSLSLSLSPAAAEASFMRSPDARKRVSRRAAVIR